MFDLTKLNETSIAGCLDNVDAIHKEVKRVEALFGRSKETVSLLLEAQTWLTFAKQKHSINKEARITSQLIKESTQPIK